MTIDPQAIQTLFARAIEIVDRADRDKFLTEQCGSDTKLHERIANLLIAFDGSKGFLDQPTQAHATQHIDAASRYQPGNIIAGRYKLLEAIGEGGMGTVWVAEQSQPVRRKVALKLVKPGMDSKQVLARFDAERQALALMDHPNIAKVFDGGVTEQGRPFFAMEYVKGMPLTEYCDHVRLSLEERLKLFVPICQAVQHAHQKGIIHRDLKPSNVLICLYDGKPVPKVIDFGLAKAMYQPLTEQTLHTGHGLMLGTPLYMSPEQAEHNNLDVDTRSDIYSLGVMLYELLTGTTPLERAQFKEAAFGEILRLIKEVEPPKPSTRVSTNAQRASVAAQRSLEPEQLGRSIRGDLDWIVMKALEKDRGRRYETANGFAADVQRYLSGEPVLAHPPTSSYKLKKLFQRNKVLVYTVSVILFALFAGIAGTTYGLFRAASETRRAIIERDKATIERDEKERARTEELVARRAAQERVVRLHVRTGNMALDRGEDFDAAHWFSAAWLSDSDNPDQDSVHRIRIGATLRTLPELKVVRFHTAALEQVDFSPSGKLVMSRTQLSKEVQCWSPETGRLKYSPLSHPATIIASEWTPDGRYIWTWAGDHALRIWNSETGELVRGPIRSSQDGVLSTGTVSPDGMLALLASPDGTIELVDTPTGKVIRNWSAQEEPVSIRFSPRGDRFACSFKRTALLFDPNQREVIATLPHVAEPIRDSFADNVIPNPSQQRLPLFSRDGRRLITLLPGSKGFCVWDAEAGKKIVEQRSVGVVNGVTFSPSGRLILGFGNGPVNDRCSVSETETGRIIGQFIGKRNISNASFFPDEKSILYRMAGSEVCRVDIGTGKFIGPILRGCGRGLLVPQVDPEGKAILFGDYDGIARIWKLPNPTSWVPYDVRSGGSPAGLFSTADGRLQIGQRTDSKLVVVSQTQQMALQDAPTDLKNCWLSPNGDFVVIANYKRANRVWNSKTGLPVAEWFNETGKDDWFPMAAFTSDNKYLYTLADASTLACRDTETWTLQTSRTIHFKDTKVRFAKLSHDNRFMGIAGTTNSALIYNTATPGTTPISLQHLGQVWALDFSPNGKFVATVSGDLTARVWDSHTGRPAGPSIRLGAAPRDVLFSPDGNLLLTKNLDETLWLWDWKTSDRIARLIPPRSSGARQSSCWFSKDGNYVVSQSFNNFAAYCIPINELICDRKEMSTYLELITGAKFDDTESIVPLSINEIRARKNDYEKLWGKLHPELALPDPFQLSFRSLVQAPVPTEVVSPDEAKSRIGEIVTVRFRVISGGVSRDKKSYHLNSCADFRDANNFEATVDGIAVERLSRIGLPEDPADLNGKTVVIRGKMGSYRNKPQLLIDEDESVWIIDQ